MSNVLLQTKFFKPALRSTLINRQHLTDHLHASVGNGTNGFAVRLTLVSAPAGFGKTTLISTWLAQFSAVRSQSLDKRSVWLSLDENDNDPIRFLVYLIGALQTAVPEVGQTAVHLLQSPQPPTLTTVLTLLINELSQTPIPLILVLDDYHLVTTPAIHQALAFLLEHLPPQLHLVLITRSDPPLPLSRLRAQGQIVEIRAHDLRFAVSEAGQFFQQVMDLPLSDEETRALDERTEGWVAGLQLVALSLKGRHDRADRIAEFTGSHRFIIDYLTEEVLNQQSDAVREFLLATSILERVCGPLADALTQSTSGQATLEYLEQSNLFLIPLDDKRCWFRYHQLFADVLRQHLQQTHPDALPTLHFRAQAWLARQGLTHEAVNHALAGHDYDQAARLIEEIHGQKWQIGEIQTVQDWLAAIPSASWQSHPRLWLVQAWANMTVGEFAQADEKLKGAEASLALLDQETAHTMRPEVLAFRASYATLTQDPSAVELAQQALDVLPADYWLRGMLVVFLGAAYYVMGNLNAALDVLLPATSFPQAALAAQAHGIHLLAFTGMVLLARGSLREATVMVRRSVALAEPGGIPIPYVGTLMAYMSASLILYEQNELDEVETYLTRCWEQAVNFGSYEVQVFSLSGLIRLNLVRDNLGAAVEYNRQMNILLQEHTFTLSIMAYVDYARFQLLLKQQNDTAVAAWVEANSGEAGPLNPYALHRLALPQFLIAQGQYHSALNELTILIEEAQVTGHGTVLVKALVLQALALYRSGDQSGALAALSHALALAEPEGYSRAFLDESGAMVELLSLFRRQALFPAFVDGLLAELNSHAPRQRDSALLPEPLTERELQVLQLLATGATNQDIAEQLYVAVSTVKKHVSNILVKLDTPNRVQAIARARELGLLS